MGALLAACTLGLLSLCSAYLDEETIAGGWWAGHGRTLGSLHLGAAFAMLGVPRRGDHRRRLVGWPWAHSWQLAPWGCFRYARRTSTRRPSPEVGGLAIGALLAACTLGLLSLCSAYLDEETIA